MDDYCLFCDMDTGGNHAFDCPFSTLSTNDPEPSPPAPATTWKVNVSLEVVVALTARATASEARVEVLEKLIRELADDLEAEVQVRYGCSKPGTSPHGALVRRYNRDMEPRVEARALLEGAKDDG